MVVVKGPMFGLDARGSLGNTITFSIRKGTNYAKTFTKATNPDTAAQQAIRTVFANGGSNWRFGAVADPTKTTWNYYASGTTESGFNRFLRYYLNSNYDSATQTVILPEVMPSPQ